MRMIPLVAAAALLLAGAATAQTPSPTPPPAAAPQAPAAPPAIKSVSIVELDELPEATRVQVNQAVATRTADDLQKLRNAIDGAPALKSALEAKGFSSRDVVVAQIDDEGELTIVTKKLS
jgi:uncharacterized lipoprotein YajG